jgi:SpoIID/LytB domain protein
MTQKFAGALKFIADGDKITAINIIGVEDYLLSVISSEMKSSATLEFLKAHAVISRSWVMSQISAHKNISVHEDTARQTSPENSVNTVPEHIEWFDHDDHKLFDVCADDHCQRYEGLSMIVGDTVRKAIDETWGQILMNGGEICDARFSKSCGGIMEKYSTCWGDTDYPYLCGKADTQEGDSPDYVLPDLTDEPEARKWIESAPDSFCNTQDNKILGQVLNDYDLETKDFFRWKVRYDRKTLSALISERCGKDIGSLLALVPLQRGVSGRLSKLEIIGTKYSLIIGKELIIRRYLSESHLKSSAFVVDYYDSEGHLIPVCDVEAYAKSYMDNDFSENHVSDINIDYIVLTGAGWGHGVGLCQIGAAVMAYKGYGYRDILRHYYPGSELERK